jgi:hydroxymethylpyrimidine/phosphomethylpyrimidine kinase
MDAFAAVEWARLYLLKAIAAAPGFGQGHQPLGHNWPFRQD